MNVLTGYQHRLNCQVLTAHLIDPKRLDSITRVLNLTDRMELTGHVSSVNQVFDPNQVCYQYRAKLLIQADYLDQEMLPNHLPLLDQVWILDRVLPKHQEEFKSQ